MTRNSCKRCKSCGLYYDVGTVHNCPNKRQPAPGRQEHARKLHGRTGSHVCPACRHKYVEPQPEHACYAAHPGEAYCTHCKMWKPETEFNPSGLPAYRCRQCQSNKSSRDYEKLRRNKALILERQRKEREEIQAKMAEAVEITKSSPAPHGYAISHAGHIWTCYCCGKIVTRDAYFPNGNTGHKIYHSKCYQKELIVNELFLKANVLESAK